MHIGQRILKALDPDRVYTADGRLDRQATVAKEKAACERASKRFDTVWSTVTNPCLTIPLLIAGMFSVRFPQLKSVVMAYPLISSAFLFLPSVKGLKNMQEKKFHEARLGADMLKTPAA